MVRYRRAVERVDAGRTGRSVVGVRVRSPVMWMKQRPRSGATIRWRHSGPSWIRGWILPPEEDAPPRGGWPVMGWQAPTGTAKRVRYARCETQRFRGVLDGYFFVRAHFSASCGGGGTSGRWRGHERRGGPHTQRPTPRFPGTVFGAASHRYPEFHGRCRRDEVIDHSMVPIGTFWIAYPSPERIRLNRWTGYPVRSSGVHTKA